MNAGVEIAAWRSGSRESSLVAVLETTFTHERTLRLDLGSLPSLRAGRAQWQRQTLGTPRPPDLLGPVHFHG